MCYEWGESGTYHANEKLAVLELPVVLRTVEECRPWKPIFEFFGGEPLLYSGIWDVIRAIRSAGCQLAFSTNGTFLEEHAEHLADTPPTRLWVSLDGPEAVNDAQRGFGVFQRAMRGVDKLHRAKRTKGSVLPELGLTCVVSPTNFRHVEELFLDCMNLSIFSAVSIELQSYATAEQVRIYGETLKTQFGVMSTPYARGYVRDPAVFAGIDFESLTQQMRNVRRACENDGIAFYSQPKTLEVDNIRNYFTANWERMHDKRTRCAVPWLAAEISARGDVTTCHTFYDLAIGNVYEQSLLDIWRGARLKKLRSYLRGTLFPICTACCRYYSD